MLPDINLLPKYERESSLLYILFIIGTFICLSLFAVVVYFYFTTKGTLEDTETQVEQLNQEKTLLEVRLNTETTVEETATLEDAVTYAEHHIVPTSHFIDELLLLLPTNGYLSNYTFNYQSVNVETQFEQMGDAALYVAELNESEYVRDVQVNQISTFELSYGQPAEEVDIEEMYDIIPRYNVSYSIIVDQAYLIEGAETVE
ncbi:hypothetical protein [Oceanobacillus bengalensis]|uniref:Fimbrial assembly protein n=1 Tax=Oceanobacillus bengalensis TaxID=1435466 RepID=A0A494YXA8_9BACI|nr:hypothetical protein [Oceanobacillus bengalensis]RKQ14655.1 hypothetical protein D8M05_12505 [Oceanobacillus bengalensis]